MTTQLASVNKCVDLIVDKVGPNIVVGIPLGIGKPNVLINALYDRAKENPRLHLKIVTALSLQVPKSSSDLEKRFLDPFVERVFGNYPDLHYVDALRNGHLPPNIQIVEFFFKSGDYLENKIAQQNYIYSNYTHVARDMMIQGVNVLTQAIAVRETDGARILSLSSNPDVSLDVVKRYKDANIRNDMLLIGVINNEMPFMPNDAIIDEVEFDIILNDKQCTHTIFAPPNMKVTLQDYAIGYHASTLVPDGGTLQIGIGSLGDAIAYAINARDKNNADYRALVRDLSAGHFNQDIHLDSFQKGLYGCSEMFVNGFMQLIKSGVIRREVYADIALQKLLNEGRITESINAHTLDVLLDEDIIQTHLNEKNVAYLKKFGIFKANVTLEDNLLKLGDTAISANLADQASRLTINKDFIGDQLKSGVYMHGGFFIGPRDFYQALRDMPDEQLNKICMSEISKINQLYGNQELASIQRTDARFMNTTMMVSLLGAATSDCLDSGKLVSGVGGQYNFVSMAHALPGARSILMLRATRESNGTTTSNIVWNYGHTTIPRHLRDIVITEYGIADLRGQSDSEIIKRLIAVADSRFQNELVAVAKANGKLQENYEVPAHQRHNTPASQLQRLTKWKAMMPDFPFGTDFTEDELTIARALQKLKAASEHPLELIKQIFSNLFEEKEVPAKYLERMKLDQPDSLKLKLARKLLVGYL